HTRFSRDWSSDVCSSDLRPLASNRQHLRPLLPRGMLELSQSSWICARLNARCSSPLPAHEQLGCSWGERSDSYALSYRSFICRRSEERRVGKECRSVSWR